MVLHVWTVSLSHVKTTFKIKIAKMLFSQKKFLLEEQSVSYLTIHLYVI